MTNLNYTPTSVGPGRFSRELKLEDFWWRVRISDSEVLVLLCQDDGTVGETDQSPVGPDVWNTENFLGYGKGELVGWVLGT